MNNLESDFEDITSNGKIISSAKLAVGESFQGRVTGLEANKNFENKKNLVMEDKEGKEFIVFTSGSLNYAVEDGKFEVGRTYRITRLENKLTKKGASRTQFQIQRLKADGADAVPTVSDEKPAVRSTKK